ncbi:MAG TPA: hypothetical protein VJ804_02480 [Acidimicrobiales bacterium]|nr:hypothetical protein [Acidimicrobiales bacterium]
MPVEVHPEEFSLVLYDAAEIRGLVERLVPQIGLPADLAIRVEIDETTPLGNARVASLDPVTLSLESGALEDAKAPRKLDPRGSTDVLGRLLFEVRDRLDPAFGDPPAADELTLPQASAWQAYCVGRLGRLGHTVQRQRRLYHFRNRHGFTDAADAAFDKLWTSDGLTWADVDSLSEAALAARSA